MKVWITLVTLIWLPLNFAQANEVSSSGALTLFYQNTSASNVRNEQILVLDLDINQRQDSGEWHIYIEGTSTSRNGRVSASYPDSIADAGGASDAAGEGRLQVSILEYSVEYNPGGKYAWDTHWWIDLSQWIYGNC